MSVGNVLGSDHKVGRDESSGKKAVSGPSVRERGIHFHKGVELR